MFYGAEAHVSNQSNCYLDFEVENTYNELLMNDLCVKIINWIFLINMFVEFATEKKERNEIYINN